MHLRLRVVHPLAIVLALLLALPQATHAEEAPLATVTWDGGGDGTSWNDPLNWDTDTVPLAGDDVVITLDATFTVDLDINATVNTLTLGAVSGLNTQTLLIPSPRVLTVTSTMTVNSDGAVTWSGGSITGGGTVNNSGTFTLASTISKTLDGGSTFNNLAAGTIIWENGSFFVQSISTVTNAGLVDAQGNNNFDGNGFGPNTFSNSGTFRKSAGTGSTVFIADLTLENTRVMEALSGTIRLTGP